MIYIAFFAIRQNRFRTAPQYSPCSLDPMPLPQYGDLAWRPSQGTKLYCLVNRGTLGVNNLPRVVARIMPRPESNPRPLDHYTTEPPIVDFVLKTEKFSLSWQQWSVWGECDWHILIGWPRKPYLRTKNYDYLIHNLSYGQFSAKISNFSLP